MKCDELKDRWFWAYPTESVDCDGITGSAHEVYSKSEVDAAIAELKRKLQDQCISCPVKMQEDDVVAEKDNEIRRLKRALWIARAERAADRERIFYFNDLETMLDIDGFSYDSKKKKGHKKLTARRWRIIWQTVERKCRSKESEYR